MIGKIYPSWVERTINNSDTYTGGTFIALLMKTSYVYDATHIFISNLTPGTNELSGGNYARVVPSGLLIVRTGSTTSITFNPIVFPLITAIGVGSAPRSLVIAKSSGSDATSALVLHQDFESAPDVNAADVTITPASSGFIRYLVTS